MIHDSELLGLIRRRNLLGADTNAKTAKGRAKGYATFIMYLAPAREAGFQTCPMATKGCAEACLFTAGRGRMDSVRDARVWKTRAFFLHRREFMDKLADEIARSIRWAERKGLTPVFRLNGTSDIRWESVPARGAPNIMALFPDVQFYDYTKVPGRDVPPNYHLTFSYSGRNGFQALGELARGRNVAVVFRSRGLANGSAWLGSDRFDVVDGDNDDLRFLDPAGSVVGLYAKGDAKGDTTGFVVDSDRIPLGDLPALKASLACRVAA